MPGYINCDIRGTIYTSDMGEMPKISLDNYYSGREIGKRGNIIVDKLMDITKPWDFESGSVEEIVMISAIEHFPPNTAKFIVSEIKRVLKSGGVLRVDFPDIPKTIKQYYEYDPEYCMRLIYCNHNDEYSQHNWGYSIISFVDLLGDGWEKISIKDIVKHNYPMIGVEAVKE